MWKGSSATSVLRATTRHILVKRYSGAYAVIIYYISNLLKQRARTRGVGKFVQNNLLGTKTPLVWHNHKLMVVAQSYRVD